MSGEAQSVVGSSLEHLVELVWFDWFKFSLVKIILVVYGLVWSNLSQPCMFISRMGQTNKQTKKKPGWSIELLRN